MFSSKLDIRLVTSVVITRVNLYKLNVHVKNLKMKRQLVHWFGLTELNETMGIVCGRNSSKTYIADEILKLSFNAQYYYPLYAAFLFWPSICYIRHFFII